MIVFIIFSNSGLFWMLIVLMKFSVFVSEALNVAGVPFCEQPPIKLDLPVWSLSTLNDDYKTTNMNIVTYATQVGIKPLPVFAISLFKGTLSFDNFKRNGWGALQLLPNSGYNVVNILGKQSGRDYDKVQILRDLGVSLSPILISSGRDQTESSDIDASLLIMNQSPMILLVENLNQDYPALDVGDHEVILCQVSRVISFAEKEPQIPSTTSYLTTKTLRDIKLI